MDHIKSVEKICKEYRDKLDRYEIVYPQLVGRRRVRGISISDLHLPFSREDLIQDIVKEYSGYDFCVVNGDLFDMYIINTFVKDKEIPFIVEYRAGLEIVRLLAKNFKRVILIDGNHEYGRYTREMSKLSPTMLFLTKISPLQFLAQGKVFSASGKDLGSINLPNVFYAGERTDGWWYRIGKTLFCHRLKGYRSGEMKNAIWCADHFINRGVDFQCLVSGHSHHLGSVPYKKGRLVIDQGALCLPMEYFNKGSGNHTPLDLGYAVIEMDAEGNVDMRNTRPVYLGTYQES